MEETKIIEPMFKYHNGVERFLALCARSNTALTYDDVLLVPQFSEINSRSSVDTSTMLKYRKMDLPFMAANMDSVTGAVMAIAMSKLGGCGVIHRYMTDVDQINEVIKVHEQVKNGQIIAVAVGLNVTVEHITQLVAAGVNTVVVDVAHGHHQNIAKTIEMLRDQDLAATDGLPLEVIAGNVATSEGVRFLYNCGAHTIKIGVGGGGVCLTRSVTGHGVPQLYAIAIAKELGFLNQQIDSFPFKIIADGGISNSGDIVKAFAVGADAVMLGSLFAGTSEAPGQPFFANGTGQLSKVFRGMASLDAQKEFYGNYVDAPEGIVKTVPYKGSVTNIVKALRGGMKSGLSYSGANNIKELYEKADWVHISTAGLQESLTR